MMTTRLVVRNGVGCLGRRAASSAFSTRGAPSRPATSRRVAIPGSRVDFAVRAVATDVDTKTTTKPFRRHERIASIKVRPDPSDRTRGSTPRPSPAPPSYPDSLFTSRPRGTARRVPRSRDGFLFFAKARVKARSKDRTR